MKGFELTEAIKREVVKEGTAGSPVKVLTEEGDVFNIDEVEIEKQPDGTHILWLKASYEGR